MRVLKNGEVKFKPSAHANESRLLEPVHPMSVRRRGEAVEVYVGCGWSKGTVLSSTRDFCCVKITKTQSSSTCYDNRNIRSPKEK